MTFVSNDAFVFHNKETNDNNFRPINRTASPKQAIDEATFRSCFYSKAFETWWKRHTSRYYSSCYDLQSLEHASERSSASHKWGIQRSSFAGKLEPQYFVTNEVSSVKASRSSRVTLHISSERPFVATTTTAVSTSVSRVLECRMGHDDDRYATSWSIEKDDRVEVGPSRFNRFAKSSDGNCIESLCEPCTQASCIEILPSVSCNTTNQHIDLEMVTAGPKLENVQKTSEAPSSVIPLAVSNSQAQPPLKRQISIHIRNVYQKLVRNVHKLTLDNKRLIRTSLQFMSPFQHPLFIEGLDNEELVEFKVADRKRGVHLEHDDIDDRESVARPAKILTGDYADTATPLFSASKTQEPNLRLYETTLRDSFRAPRCTSPSCAHFTNKFNPEFCESLTTDLMARGVHKLRRSKSDMLGRTLLMEDLSYSNVIRPVEKVSCSCNNRRRADLSQSHSADQMSLINFASNRTRSSCSSSDRLGRVGRSASPLLLAHYNQSMSTLATSPSSSVESLKDFSIGRFPLPPSSCEFGTPTPYRRYNLVQPRETASHEYWSIRSLKPPCAAEVSRNQMKRLDSLDDFVSGCDKAEGGWEVLCHVPPAHDEIESLTDRMPEDNQGHESAKCKTPSIPTYMPRPLCPSTRPNSKYILFPLEHQPSPAISTEPSSLPTTRSFRSMLCIPSLKSEASKPSVMVSLTDEKTHSYPRECRYDQVHICTGGELKILPCWKPRWTATCSKRSRYERDSVYKILNPRQWRNALNTAFRARMPERWQEKIADDPNLEAENTLLGPNSRVSNQQTEKTDKRPHRRRLWVRPMKQRMRSYSCASGLRESRCGKQPWSSLRSWAARSCLCAIIESSADGESFDDPENLPRDVPMLQRTGTRYTIE